MYQILCMGAGRGGSWDFVAVRKEGRRVGREPGRVASSIGWVLWARGASGTGGHVGCEGDEVWVAVSEDSAGNAVGALGWLIAF